MSSQLVLGFRRVIASGKGFTEGEQGNFLRSEMFYILIWAMVTQTHSAAKNSPTLRPVYFTVNFYASIKKKTSWKIHNKRPNKGM